MAYSADANTDTKVQRHQSYYLEDVIFLVENSLFKVHRHYFAQESEVFEAMFSLPAGEGNETDGSTDENPIRLDGIKKADFEQLLRVMYLSPWRGGEAQILTVEQWVAVLELSTMWNLVRIREVAIDAIHKSSNDTVERLRIALKYHIESWMPPALKDLMYRAEPIGMREVEHLGIDLTMRLVGLRDSLRKPAEPKARLFQRGVVGMFPELEGHESMTQLEFGFSIV